MKIIKKWNKWANSHSYFVIDFLRVLIGMFMLYKGLSFMANPEYYDLFSEELSKLGGGINIVHLVVSINVVGGIMIIVGLLTRWVILVQIPILIGVAIVNITGKMELQNFILALLILFVFIFFLFFGSGKHSADYYLKMQV